MKYNFIDEWLGAGEKFSLLFLNYFGDIIGWQLLVFNLVQSITGITMTMCCSVRTLVLCAVTLCHLWGCGSWVECWQTGAGGEVEVVRVGIILEDREIDQQLVEHELQTLSQSLPHNIKIEPR